MTRTYLLWIIAMAILLAGSLYVIAVSPSGDKWDRSVAVKVCGGLLVVRQDNGSLWLLRNSWRAYRVEDLEKLECSR